MNTVWLIERTDLGAPHWFAVQLGEFAFSADPADAVRFAREQDAEDVMDSEFFAGHQVEAKEHLFLCAQRGPS